MFYHLGSLGFQNPTCMPPSMPLEMPGKYIIPMNDLSATNTHPHINIYVCIHTHASLLVMIMQKEHASIKYI
jgi:hypothetical protein